MHILGAILCLAVATIVTSVLLSEYRVFPGWVTLLCVAAIVLLVVNAIRVYQNGRERIRRAEGPRTRIVLSDSAVPPPPHKPKPTADD